MSGNFWLDWADLALSWFNTILLLWLGLTVLLNAERRTWGMWLSGGGLLAGGVFFISHTALLGHGTAILTPGLDFWWRLGWVPVVGLPMVWYVVILWYSGCWEKRNSVLWRQHRGWFALAAVLFIGLTGLLLADALPSFYQLAQFNLETVPSLWGIPVLLLVFPVYILVCIGLSLWALHRPEPSARLMGDQARQRARPWLVRTAFALLAASLLVGVALYWGIGMVEGGPSASQELLVEAILTWFDLAIAACIAISVLLLGQAVTAHEIFTGKSLPRRGLSLLWRRSLVLAAGYSLVVGWCLAIQLRPVYSLLLSTLILVVFYALVGWRQYAERQELIEHLRPFVTSQRLYDRVILSGEGESSRAGNMLTALCEQILGVRKALLLPLGSMITLTEGPINYPGGPHQQALPEWISHIPATTSPTSQALDPVATQGYLWEVPLWSQQGLSGILALGEKQDGGLFTQEEIEIARASGEQILDTMASAELARRLMQLQRQQMAESQVYDRQLRRALHDDILPQLHGSILALNTLKANETGKESLVNSLTDLHHQVSNLLRGLKSSHALEVSRLGILGALHSVIEDELESAFERVDWEIQPEAETRLETLSPATVDVLYYATREAIRNAAAHAGSGESHLPCLVVKVTCDVSIKIQVEDDGGKMAEASSGSGRGLVLHSTMMSIVGGSMKIESVESRYTRVTMELPLNPNNQPL